MLEEAPKLGYVVSVSGARVTGVLAQEDDRSQGAEDAGRIQIGALVQIGTPRTRAFGVISGLSMPAPSSPPAADDLRTVEIDLLGEALLPAEMSLGTGGGPAIFQRGISIYPALGEPIRATNADDLAQVYARPTASNIRIGSIHQDAALPAYVLTDELLGGHSAILGTTGSGKSCSVALLLRALLETHPNGHVLLIDPHSEYEAAFGAMAEVVTTETLQLPYWLLNFEEISAVLVSRTGGTAESEAAILSEAIVDAKARFINDPQGAESLTIDTPVPYRLSDVLRHIDDAMGTLNKTDGSAPYLRLKARIEALRADRRFGFMFGGVVVRDIMAEVLSRLFRIPVSGRPITILDLSGVPSEIVDVVVSVLVRMIFDFAVWSDRRDAVPTLLVCEEAHRYIPREADAGFGPTRKAVSRIAKEGRKYGVSLCLVTQRPSEISESILSQCNTLFALRMTNERDQDFVQRALPETAMGFFSTLPALRPQEAIVVGEGVTLPMRIRLDDLPAATQPRSQTMMFSKAWQEDRGDVDLVAQTITRWRMQAR